MTEQVTTSDIARYLAVTNQQQGENVEKILVRQVNPQLYACQVWLEGEKEPSSQFISLDENA